MKKYKLLTYSLLISFLAIQSCKKENDESIDLGTTASQDNGAAENAFADIKRVVEEAADDEGQSAKLSGGVKSGSYSFGSCATVSINPGWLDPNWPKVMEIDFGSTNCQGAYGINRRGKLIVTLTDHYRDSGSTLTIQPQNYHVNDVKVEGTKTITNQGYNTSGNLQFDVDVVNGKLTYTNGDVTTWQSTRINEWVEGDSTTLFTHGLAGICDDVYLITGSASGVSRNNTNYSVTITTPLRKEICCRWLVSGELEVAPNGLHTRYVDFGNGTCDNKATVTINGTSFIVPMF